MISDVKSMNKVWNEQKSWKPLKKVVQPAIYPKAGRKTQQSVTCFIGLLHVLRFYEGNTWGPDIRNETKDETFATNKPVSLSSS